MSHEKIQIGDCTLYRGDCLDILASVESHVVITDPPYGVTYQSNSAAGRGTKPITNDGTRLSLALYRQIIPLLKTGHVLWFTRWDAWPDVWAVLGQYYPIRGLLVWDKGTPGMGDLSHWGPSYEMIASAGSGFLRGGRDGSVLRFNTVKGLGRNHPTEKPVDLLAHLIEKISDPGDTILDPFMGSGTAAVACARTGRKFIGCEIDAAYFQTACRRAEQAYTDHGLLAMMEGAA
jgi:site-specific DNA-methyltransferase (adenine-specific)